MGYAKGFVPLYDKPKQTIDNSHCQKCSRSMWSHRNGDDYYTINGKPYCVEYARELCNRYGIKLKVQNSDMKFRYTSDESNLSSGK